MLIWLIAAVLGVAAALVLYARDRRALRRGVIPALLRAGALALLLAMLLGAPAGRARMVRPLAALDASSSWRRGGDSATWRQALARAREAGADSLLLFGDTVRAIGAGGAAPDAPRDAASRVRPAVERALAAGRPLVVVTDGELDDPDALGGLPAGSRIVVLPRRAAPDAALSGLESPRAVVGGDTIEVSLRVSAGAAGAGAGTVRLAVGDAPPLTVPLPALGANAELPLTARLRVTGDGPTLLTAVVSSALDAEPRNDTLAVGLDVSPAAGAVFVSTSPDMDARFALAVLRGALALPTRGYFRVARGPNGWRVDGSLAPVAEAEVRRALRESPLVVLHGDSTAFGPTATATRGALALIAPPATSDGEWYAVSAPPSPLSGALGAVAWDSLPPLDVSRSAPRLEWEALVAARARRYEQRVAIAGRDRPRREVIIGASGFWRWQFRAGAGAEAFQALWGSIFDWLAAERRDQRAALPDAPLLRAGEPVRWRRGAGADSVVVVALRRRGDGGRTDSVSLRFPAGAIVTESAPLVPGVYDVHAAGGPSLLVVNASREWLPRRPAIASGAVGGASLRESAPRLMDAGWPFIVVLVLLCGEWMVRRRVGMR